MNTANELEQMMGQLSDLVDKGGTTVVTAKDTLVDGVKTTNIGLETALGLIEEVRKLLDRFMLEGSRLATRMRSRYSKSAGTR